MRLHGQGNRRASQAEGTASVLECRTNRTATISSVMHMLAVRLHWQGKRRASQAEETASALECRMHRTAMTISVMHSECASWQPLLSLTKQHQMPPEDRPHHRAFP